MIVKSLFTILKDFPFIYILNLSLKEAQTLQYSIKEKKDKQRFLIIIQEYKTLMLISQGTVEHHYSCDDPLFGTKKYKYEKKNYHPCQQNCIDKDGQLIKVQGNNKIKYSKPPTQTSDRYKGQVDGGIKASAQYQKTQKYSQNQMLTISGTGQRTETIHYIDQTCSQTKKNRKEQEKEQQKNTNKKNNGGLVLALGLVAVGGYVGGYHILKKSFQEEKERPTSEQGKVIGNIVFQATVATGGTVGGAIYGASVGAIAGPVGAFIGGGIGMLAGSAVGYGLKKIMPWNW